MTTITDDDFIRWLEKPTVVEHEQAFVRNHDIAAEDNANARQAFRAGVCLANEIDKLNEALKRIAMLSYDNYAATIAREALGVKKDRL